MAMDWQEIVSRALARDIRAVSRLISIVEDRRSGFEAAYAAIYPRTGKAHVVGITGPPGSGKSTLVDKMAAEYRGRGKTVGIVAIDPTSPFTGGALLGDRLRMQRHSLDDGVFIRSMGTRGHLGGVARATSGVVDVLDHIRKHHEGNVLLVSSGGPSLQTDRRPRSCPCGWVMTRIDAVLRLAWRSALSSRFTSRRRR